MGNINYEDLDLDDGFVLSQRQAIEFLRVVAQGKYWLQEDGDMIENITDEEAVNEWRTLVECVAYC